MAHNLVGALEDLMHAQVPHEALNLVLLRHRTKPTERVTERVTVRLRINGGNSRLDTYMQVTIPAQQL